MDLIYTQSGVLYKIIPNAPQSNFDHEFKPGPHVDGIVGSASAKFVDQVSNKMRNFSINQSVIRQAMNFSHPTQSGDVLSVHSSDQMGNQQPKRKKKKGINNRRGGNSKENQNDDKK